MRPDIDNPEKLATWLAAPRPAAFQGLDLRECSEEMAGLDLDGCSFFGCTFSPLLAHAVMAYGCLVLRSGEGLPFNPFRSSLYHPDELYDRFDPARPDSYAECTDAVIYRSFMTRDEHGAAQPITPVDLEVTLMRRLHDAGIAEELEELLTPDLRRRSVAVLGGHDAQRNEDVYRQIAEIAQRLTLGHGLAHPYFIVTGGGPGLMEAANLGAYTAGFDDPQSSLTTALEILRAAPKYTDARWLAAAFEAKAALGEPPLPHVSRSLGIPTWFYGHEPPNAFATDIAKYFENSIREEGLLAVAGAGAIFAKGNAGTVQEIFQDACQNYYKTYGGVVSPMALFGVEYWTTTKPLVPLLTALALEKKFSDFVLTTDDPNEIVNFIDAHPPVGTIA